MVPRLTKVRIAALAILLLVATTLGSASLSPKHQGQEWKGEISDSFCKAEHQPFAEGEPPLPGPECTRICVKNGSKYVLVTAEAVYGIVNQDNPELSRLAGSAVRIEGELKGDAITISKIEAQP